MISGKVIRGFGLAKKLGFPTMNLHPKKMPEDFPYGVYAVWVKTPKGVYLGALHYGPRKVHDAPVSLEVHAIGFKGNTYGKTISITFVKRIRGTKNFRTIDALTRAIDKDILATGKILEHI